MKKARKENRKLTTKMMPRAKTSKQAQTRGRNIRMQRRNHDERNNTEMKEMLPKRTLSRQCVRAQSTYGNLVWCIVLIKHAQHFLKKEELPSQHQAAFDVWPAAASPMDACVRLRLSELQCSKDGHAWKCKPDLISTPSHVPRAKTRKHMCLQERAETSFEHQTEKDGNECVVPEATRKCDFEQD